MLCVRRFYWLRFLLAPAGIEYHLAAAIKKKPLRQGRRGCFFSRPSGRSGQPFQPPISPLITGPNSSHFSPLNRII
jgi:hypothetical protein